MGISYADWGLVIVSMMDGVAELYYYDGLHIPAVSLHMHAHARLFDDGAICVYADDQVIKFDICDCCDIAKYCNNTEMLYLCEVHRCINVKYVKFYGFVIVL